MGSTLPGLVLDSFEWLISVSSAGFQGMTDAGGGGGGGGGEAAPGTVAEGSLAVVSTKQLSKI